MYHLRIGEGAEKNVQIERVGLQTANRGSVAQRTSLLSPPLSIGGPLLL